MLSEAMGFIPDVLQQLMGRRNLKEAFKKHLSRITFAASATQLT